MAQTDVALTAARDEAAQLTTVVGSAVSLFGTLSTMLDENADDPDEIHAIAATLRNQRETLAQAIIENTPSSEEPPPPPPPPVEPVV